MSSYAKNRNAGPPQPQSRPRSPSLPARSSSAFQSIAFTQESPRESNTTMVFDANVNQRRHRCEDDEAASNVSPPVNAENQRISNPVNILSAPKSKMDAHAMQTPHKEDDAAGTTCAGAAASSGDKSGGVSFVKTPPSTVRPEASPQPSATKFLWCTPKTQIRKRVSDDATTNASAAQQLLFSTPSAYSTDVCPVKPKAPHQSLQCKSLHAAIQDANGTPAAPSKVASMKTQLSDSTSDLASEAILSPTNTPLDRLTRFSPAISKHSSGSRCLSSALNLAAPPPFSSPPLLRGRSSHQSKPDRTPSPSATPLTDTTPRCESPSHFRSLMTQFGDNSPVSSALRIDSTKGSPQSHRFPGQGLSKQSPCSFSNAASKLRVQQLRSLNNHKQSATALRHPSQTISSKQSSALSTASCAVDALAKYSPNDMSDASDETVSSSSQRKARCSPDSFTHPQSSASQTLPPVQLSPQRQRSTFTDPTSTLAVPTAFQLTNSPSDSRSTARPCSMSDAALPEGVSTCSQADLGWSRPFPVLSSISISQPISSFIKPKSTEAPPTASVRAAMQPATLHSNLLSTSRLTSSSDPQSSTTPSPNSSTRPVLSLFNSKRVPRARIDTHELSSTTIANNNACSSATDCGDRSGTGTSSNSQPRQAQDLSRSDSYGANDEAKEAVLFIGKAAKDAPVASTTSPLFSSSSLEPPTNANNTTNVRRPSQGNSPNFYPPLTWCYNVSTGCLSTYGSADERSGGRETTSAKRLSPMHASGHMIAPQARTVANAMRERWEENHILMAGRLECSERMLEVERERVRQLRRALQSTQQQMQALKRASGDASSANIWDKLDDAIGRLCAQSEEFGLRVMSAVSARVNQRPRFGGKIKKTMQQILTWFSIALLIVGLLLNRCTSLRPLWSRLKY